MTKARLWSVYCLPRVGGRTGSRTGLFWPPAHFHHSSISHGSTWSDIASRLKVLFPAMLCLYSNPRGETSLIFRFARVCNGCSECFWEFRSWISRLAKPGIVPFGPLRNGGQFKSFQEKQKEQFPEEYGGFRCHNGAAQKTPHCYGNGAFLFLWSRHIKLPEFVMK